MRYPSGCNWEAKPSRIGTYTVPVQLLASAIAVGATAPMSMRLRFPVHVPELAYWYTRRFIPVGVESFDTSLQDLVLGAGIYAVGS